MKGDEMVAPVAPDWGLEEVLAATTGRLAEDAAPARFRALATDSRKMVPGALFIALSGENFAGEAFAAEAVRQGAAGLLLSREPQPALPVPTVLVADTLRALGDLAAWRRRRMAGLRVIGITGSSGKTTVKEMTAAILSRRFSLLKTGGNFNNLVGLPLTLLQVAPGQQWAVLEMGMNRPGEIARLTEIAAPDLACITNVQGAHLLGLADIGGVARAKEELFAGLAPTATMIVNLDDPLVRAMAGRYNQTQISFGLHPRAQVRGTYVRADVAEGIAFTLRIGREESRVRLRCLGRHNVVNALAAAALAHGAGVGLADIVQGLEAFTPYDKRFQVEPLPAGVRLVNDTYNANPSSMLAALETVAEQRRGHRAVAVLGDMLELGEESLAAHRRIGAAVARLGFARLLAYGEMAGEMVAAARAEGLAGNCGQAYVDKGEIVAQLTELIRRGELTAGDWVLVKGSRGMRMETVIAALKEAR